MLDNIDLGFDNSRYHAQPHPIIAYYVTYNVSIYSPGRIIFTEAVTLQLNLNDKASCRRAILQYKFQLLFSVFFF